LTWKGRIETARPWYCHFATPTCLTRIQPIPIIPILAVNAVNACFTLNRQRHKASHGFWHLVALKGSFIADSSFSDDGMRAEQHNNDAFRKPNLIFKTIIFSMAITQPQFAF
jgi:hypothetical protein